MTMLEQDKNALFESQIASLGSPHRGKVRDLYDLDDQHLLIVTTDRISAFDVVLPTPIPEKGIVLTRLTEFWLNRSRALVTTHQTDLALESVITSAEERAILAGRFQIVKKYPVLPIEAIVRGYLVGSGWKDYQRTGAVCGVPLPAGLQQAEKLTTPLFTPSTKAAVGQHDENISIEQARVLLGSDILEQVRQVSLQLYTQAADYARQRGIIIADTKFEFGLAENGQIVLIDEVLTPDSSRFWPVADYRLGISPPSYDKQYVRDYLETLNWNKEPPGPALPVEVVRHTTAKYWEAYTRLTQ